MLTDKFTLDGLNVTGVITSVYDGDSVHAVFYFKDQYYRWVCRLTGIDTPEVRTKNEDEKIMGLKVRDALREKILHHEVFLRCGKFDKYGRLLVTIFIDDVNVNDWLITNHFAYEYHGKTKQKWTGELLE